MPKIQPALFLTSCRYSSFILECVSVKPLWERQVDVIVAYYRVMVFLERQYAVVAQSDGSTPDNHSHFASWKMMPSV
jgi:hypothetical protein